MTFIYLIGLGLLLGLLFIANLILDNRANEGSKKKINRKEDTIGNEKQYYQARDKFFSRSEYMFFQELEKQNNNKYHIFSKVRLEDIVQVIPTLEWKVRNNKRKSIRSRHIDFVLINKETGKVHCAIELDGKSHNTQKQQKSDEKKDMALKQAGISLHRVRVGSSFEDKINKILGII